MDHATLVDAHLDAYAEPDTARRSAAIERLWASDGRLIDPPLAARGHAEIVAQGAALLSQFPGHRFRRSTAVDVHHGHVRFGWQLVGPDGAVVLEGMDVGTLRADGRLAQIVGFFGGLQLLAGGDR